MSNSYLHDHDSDRSSNGNEACDEIRGLGYSDENDAFGHSKNEILSISQEAGRLSTQHDQQYRQQRSVVHDRLLYKSAAKPSSLHSLRQQYSNDITGPMNDSPVKATAVQSYLPLHRCDSSPSPVDDAVHILYAVDQITRFDGPSILDAHNRAHHPLNSMSILTPPETTEHYDINRTQVRQDLQQLRSTPVTLESRKSEEGPMLANSIKPTDSSDQQTMLASPQESRTVPSRRKLDGKPWMLWSSSLLLGISLHIILIGALLFCIIFSAQHDGFTSYTGLHTWSYFVFKYLTQFVACFLFLYTQTLLAELVRVWPFVLLANFAGHEAEAGIGCGLSSSPSLPRPGLFRRDQPLIGRFYVLLWMQIFVIPLYSALFVAIPSANGFRWTTVHGVAWTLVGVYVLALVALILLHRQLIGINTGLERQPRTIRDILDILSCRENVLLHSDSRDLSEWQSVEAVLQKDEPSGRLRRSTKLHMGTSHMRKTSKHSTSTVNLTQGPISASSHRPLTGSDTRTAFKPGNIKYHGVQSSFSTESSESVPRACHTPSILQPKVLWSLTILLAMFYITILILSFLPQTALSKGFLPKVSSAITTGNFSPSTFLYSFLPSLIGLLIYTLLQNLYNQLSIITPWVELNLSKASNTPSIPRKTEKALLLEYASRTELPFTNVLSAIRNEHHIIALLSVIAPLSLLLSILGGGFLFPLTALPSNTILIFPDLIAFYIILGIFGLVVVILIIVTIKLSSQSTRRSHRLPYPPTSLANIAALANALGVRVVDCTSSREMHRSDASNPPRPFTTTKQHNDSEIRPALPHQSPYSLHVPAVERLGGNGWLPTDWSGWDKEMGITGRTKTTSPK